MYGPSTKSTRAPVTVHELQAMRARGERIVALTAYDHTTARIADEAGVDVLLVGDSLGMVVLGYDSTLPVTMEEMLHHTRAVARGTRRAWVIGDMPFMAYHASVEEAVRNAGRFLKEGGAKAVKLEGGQPHQLACIRAITQAGIPLVAHLGFTPQAVHAIGLRVQAKTTTGIEALIAEAAAVEAAGASALVLELVPAEVAERVTAHVGIPTIGIGAGAGCSGQIQVVHDLLGLDPTFLPRHAKRYATLHEPMVQAMSDYAADVRAGQFPEAGHSAHVNVSALPPVEA
ncbi:MAG: 3-methyl-2-oxobutanoate hydroxymethyltransferase [Candidatus Sericytochromatia bacterium]|nr:3-methyl-2-oxobutanoate hydroxymethyltransferase [Candidatus Sericytochromatia bacterium]MEB3221408.1 3-methyl-2-oxobutanoate hydroxymethyltransferase [Candidatus Sericytochromatia bacterium]